MHQFVNLPDLALLAGTTRRAIAKAVARALREGTAWRGAALTVKQVQGRGGRAGVSYAVRVDSLPLALQEAWNASRRSSETPLRGDEATAVECERRFTIVHPAIGLAKHTSERRSAIREIVSRDHVGPDGVGFRVSVRTVERYLSEHEAKGKAGLLRTQRIDRIERRTRILAAAEYRRLLSSAFDSPAKDIRAALRKPARRAPLPSTIERDAEVAGFLRARFAQGATIAAAHAACLDRFGPERAQPLRHRSLLAAHP